jgi:hypothetical protein
VKSLFCCALALVAFAATALGRDYRDRCADCGCQAVCCKVCRAVETTKKVPKVIYDCECEDFCVPGPSARSIECDECGHKKHVYTPTCAEVRTRKKLVKREKVEEVKSTEWVVENLCRSCADKCDAPAADPVGPKSTQAGAATTKASRVGAVASLKNNLGWVLQASFSQP